MKQHYMKGASLALVTAMYLFALGIGVGIFNGVETVMPEIWALLVTDVVMTVIIWAFGLLFVGLWKQGRHPNYFGEIMMWWGVWLMYASLRGIDWLMLAPFAMTDLFLFISIPMMERRQLAPKPEYAAYRKRTRLFV